MHFVGQFVMYPTQKGSGHYALTAGMQLGKGHLIGAVNGHKEVPASFCGLHFGKINVQVADGTVFKFLFRRALPVLA